MMNDVGEVGLFPPPEDPQLLGVGFDFASPHTQQIGLHTAHEAAQDRVVLGRGRDHRPVFPTAAKVVATPFNARQLRLGDKRGLIKTHVTSQIKQQYGSIMCIGLNIIQSSFSVLCNIHTIDPFNDKSVKR